MEKQRYQTPGSRVTVLVQTYEHRYRQFVLVLMLSLMLTMGIVGTAAATQTSTSPSYSVTETQFGIGSQEHQCSTSYCAKSSAGDTTVGNSSSENYSAQFGGNTTDVPILQVVATGGVQDLGVLDSAHTGTAVSSLNVKSYLMQGYSIQMMGSAPSQGTHTLTTLTLPTTSQPGQEQFGINLVDNSTPNIGADPVKLPSNESAMSYISSGYSNPDQFKYVDQDIIAENYSESGEVEYTLSMILNISNATPGGRYTSDFSAVVVPFF